MKLVRLTYTLLAIFLVIILIYYGKVFLVPIILAIVLWYFINTVNELIRMIPVLGTKIPKGITLFVSSIFILSILVFIGGVIGQTINSMIEVAPSYRVNLEQQIGRLMVAVGYTETITIKTILADLDVNSYLRDLLNSFGSIAQKALLILLYTLFLLIEQNTFPRKIAAMRMDKDKKERLTLLVAKINSSVRTYIGVKFAASFATAFLSYLVIQYAGLDFALFLAFLIFVFNFIPTIGSIVATIFPSMIALVQFEYLTPFFIVLAGVGMIQICIGAVLEPKLYGDSLNISPFVIVLSLVLWGLLWGVVGMLLCVPIMVITINVLAQFPKTEPVALLLTRKGRL